MTGYVSQEPVQFSAFELPPIVIKVHAPTVAEAFVELETCSCMIPPRYPPTFTRSLVPYLWPLPTHGGQQASLRSERRGS
jgi:hypothetical protein